MNLPYGLEESRTAIINTDRLGSSHIPAETPHENFRRNTGSPPSGLQDGPVVNLRTLHTTLSGRHYRKDNFSEI